VVGEPLRRSWWGHPRGGAIYRLLNELTDHPDVILTKLISAKVTFVHRRLWPAVVAVGRSREDWQLDGLSEAAALVLRMVSEAGRLAWDEVPPFLPPRGRPSKEAAQELEKRLLVYAEEVHTSTGAHAKNLVAWDTWAAAMELRGALPSPGDAQRELERVVDSLNHAHAADARLPWQPLPRRSKGLRPGMR
jgi:hypothetical protein